MRTELAAEGFLRHRGLILTAVGGAVVEGSFLTFLSPDARSVAPQVTAIPALAAYHDLRWLFADTQSWLWFAALVVAVLVVRSALDAVLLRLAWPREAQAQAPGLGRAFVSCAALTLLAWLLLTPAVTLAFGAAVLPFSWPFLAAFPILLGIVVALSHGGVLTAWWQRLPPGRAMLWMGASFLTATAAAAVLAHLSAPGALFVIGLAGLVNARAWYGLAGLAVRAQPRVHVSVPAKVVFSLPFAPIAGIAVLALVAGTARLMFTGTIQLPISPAPGAAAGPALAGTAGGQTRPAAAAGAVTANAVLVVGGWGSSCCGAADGLRAALPGVPVRQFSYLGLDARGDPRPSGASADDLPLNVLGDMIAGQVKALHAASGRPVAVVAESEGTLGVYAMLARDRGLPVSSVALLSPIVSPGQLSYPQGTDGAPVPEDALDELNTLVGGMSPYGSGGATDLLSSVGEFGARYFSAVANEAASGERGSDGKAIRWLAVIPLADAVTLPDCVLPLGVIVVPALHGGLLGDPQVLAMVTSFLSGHRVSGSGDGSLRAAAELISGAAAAWRMPQTRAACPAPSG
jgi:hypothetical protein